MERKLQSSVSRTSTSRVYTHAMYARIIRTTINRLSDARADSYLILQQGFPFIIPADKAQERIHSLAVH